MRARTGHHRRVQFEDVGNGVPEALQVNLPLELLLEPLMELPLTDPAALESDAQTGNLDQRADLGLRKTTDLSDLGIHAFVRKVHEDVSKIKQHGSQRHLGGHNPSPG